MVEHACSFVKGVDDCSARRRNLQSEESALLAESFSEPTSTCRVWPAFYPSRVASRDLRGCPGRRSCSIAVLPRYAGRDQGLPGTGYNFRVVLPTLKNFSY